MFAILNALGMFVADLFKSRTRLEAENLFLRHQLTIALRQAPSRLRLRGGDRTQRTFRLSPSMSAFGGNRTSPIVRTRRRHDKNYDFDDGTDRRVERDHLGLCEAFRLVCRTSIVRVRHHTIDRFLNSGLATMVDIGCQSTR
jgi:hypothetical protein